MTIGTLTSGPAPTAAEQARWAPYRATAIAQARRDHAHDWGGMAASVTTGLLIVAAAITGVMTLPLLTVIITGSLIVTGALLALVACWLIDRANGRTEVFREHQGTPQPGRCSCGVHLRQPASKAEAAAVATMTAEPAAKAAPVLLPPMEHSPDWDTRDPAEVPFTEEAGTSAVLERAAKLLPPGFDPKVDSLVDGIPPLRLDGQIRDGAL